MTGTKVGWRRAATCTVGLVVLLTAGLGGSSGSAVGLGSGQARTAVGGSSGGVMTVGVPMATWQPVPFDPAQYKASPYNFYFTNAPIYGTLLRLTPNGKLVSELASSVTVADASTLQVTVRSGVTFSDGTAFDANAVKAGLERTLANRVAAYDPPLRAISAIEVTGPQSLVIRLSSPVAGALYTQLADVESFIVSPTAAKGGNLNSAPVGAGPFMLQSATSNRIVLVKNPKYWDAKNIKISELVFVDIPAGPEQVNAIKSGLVNSVTPVPVDTMSTLVSDKNLNVVSKLLDGRFTALQMCKNSGPLANASVRQALYYATNREAIRKALFPGGELVQGLWPKSSPLYDRELARAYPYNPKKAKALLAEAGYSSGLSLTVMPWHSSPKYQQVAEIIQEDWKKVGVNVTIVPSSNPVQDWLVSYKTDILVNPGIRPGIAKAGSFIAPALVACKYSNPAYSALVDKLRAATPGSPQEAAIWKEIGRFASDNAFTINISWEPTGIATTKAIKNLKIQPYNFPVPYYWGVSTKG